MAAAATLRDTPLSSFASRASSVLSGAGVVSSTVISVGAAVIMGAGVGAAVAVEFAAAQLTKSGQPKSSAAMHPANSKRLVLVMSQPMLSTTVHTCRVRENRRGEGGSCFKSLLLLFSSRYWRQSVRSGRGVYNTLLCIFLYTYIEPTEEVTQEGANNWGVFRIFIFISCPAFLLLFLP